MKDQVWEVSDRKEIKRERKKKKKSQIRWVRTEKNRKLNTSTSRKFLFFLLLVFLFHQNLLDQSILVLHRCRHCDVHVDDQIHSYWPRMTVQTVCTYTPLTFLSLVNLRHLLSDEWVLLEFLSMVVVAGVRWCSLDVQWDLIKKQEQRNKEIKLFFIKCYVSEHTW